jgi:ABC-2 type transport system permease protein
MTYEFNVYGNIVMQTIIMITSACFWKALYKGQGLVGDVDADSMLTYVVLSSLLSVLLITNVEQRIEMSVVKGTVATDMMKPVNIFGIYFAEDIGNILALVFQNCCRS